MNGSAVFLIAFLTAAATATGTVYVIEKNGFLRAPPVPDSIVPDLKGVTENDARANAAVAHIALLVASHEASADAKTGTVLRQSINAGQHVSRDYPVSIVLAEEIPKVPNVADLKVPEAKQRLELKGFTLAVGATIANATVPVDHIFDQSPKADTPLAKGSTVTVQVSGGPGDVLVPKLVGVSLNQAKTDLEKLGVKPVVRWVAMAETPTYVVLNQKPAPGEKVKPGSDIQLTVCR
jgi:eukaryotic-like serine/threonine-protein kinase